MAIELDIQAAIEKNLSAEVGATLKKRLDLAEADARKVAEQRQFIEKLKTEVEDLTSKVKTQEAIEARLQKVETSEKALRETMTDARVIQLREEHAKERVADMKHLVGLVFQNNQFKYNVVDNGYLPVSTQMGSCVQQSSHSRTITATGEGAPPPSPGDVSR